MKALYYIEGKYGTRAWERIDSATSEIGALSLLDNYMKAFGIGWKFHIKHRGESVYFRSMVDKAEFLKFKKGDGYGML